MFKVITSNICSQFSDNCVGTKVQDSERFMAVLIEAIKNHDFSKDTIPGQAFLNVKDAVPFISAGVGKTLGLGVNSFVLKEYRGNVSAYLKRKHASIATNCNVVVYTKEAYLNDPDINETPGEADRIIHSNADYVIVAVLSDVEGYKSVLSPYRFVMNLAGGNHLHLNMTADEIRSQACEIANNVQNWSVVSD